MKPIPVLNTVGVHDCKICTTPSPTLGGIDFNKSSKEWNNYSPLPSGTMVYYNRCPKCGFLFTCGLDKWTDLDFLEYIYNENFSRIDHGAKIREMNNSRIIENLFKNEKENIKILDFGGGEGGFSHHLTGQGFDTEFFDPYIGSNKILINKKYELITCFEVMEHVTDPKSIIKEIIRLLSPNGIVIFSTVLIPNDFDDRGLFWTYVNPRGGHISIHSKESLGWLWNQNGYNFSSFNEEIHIAYKEVPAFAKHLFGK